jgi:membrane protein implicated in regulation of membrane protease activity
MMPLNGFGKLLIILGGILIIVGAVVILAGKIPWLGRLPGDIYIERRNFSFFFPLTTSILVSVILSLVLYLVSRR